MPATEVAKSADIADGAVLGVRAAGRAVLLARVGGELHAFENRCPHLGLPLTRGKVENGAIRCPFHGSRFDLCSGANLDWVNSLAGLPLPQWSRGLVAFGRQPAGLVAVDVHEQGGVVFVERSA